MAKRDVSSKPEDGETFSKAEEARVGIFCLIRGLRLGSVVLSYRTWDGLVSLLIMDGWASVVSGSL